MMNRIFFTIIAAIVILIFVGFAAALLDNLLFVKTGKASWYSVRDRGIRRRTASNEIFNDKAMTCAMWDAKFNQRVEVTNTTNNRSVIVRVNDRGPNKRLVKQGVIIDLTKAAFSKLGSLKKGVIDVSVRLLSRKRKE